jgi:hypothetical protein
MKDDMTFTKNLSGSIFAEAEKSQNNDKIYVKFKVHNHDVKGDKSDYPFLTGTICDNGSSGWDFCESFGSGGLYLNGKDDLHDYQSIIRQLYDWSEELFEKGFLV